MHNFVQFPKGFYSMDIVIVYNDGERKVSKKFLSLQPDDNITTAPRVTLRLNLGGVKGDNTGRAN
jgi:hypothetical protein